MHKFTIGAAAIFALMQVHVANADERQYRAAMVKLFLWNYKAFAIFALNPVFPGDVVRLDNETITLDHRRCYPQWPKPQYAALSSVSDSGKIGITAGGAASADLLLKEIAEIEAKADVKFERETTFMLDPLAETHARDEAALSVVAPTPECALIPALLNGQRGRDVVVQKVLHGVRKYSVALKYGANLDASAKGELLKLLKGVLNVSDAEVKGGLGGMSVTKADAPGPLDLAIVPANLSAEDVAWVTNYLAGDRGAALAQAVEEAIQAREKSALESAIYIIRYKLFGGDYERVREIWARRFVSEGKMLSVEDVTPQQARAMAIFGAAAALTQERKE